MKKYFAEFLGTGFYVFFGTFATIMITQSNSIDAEILPIAPALAFGTVYIGCYFAFIVISGAHFNPAISIAAFINKHIDFKELLLYILFQLIGAFIAILAISIIFPDGQANNLGYTSYSINYNHTSAFVYEFIGSFILCFLYLTIVENEDTVIIGGLFIGLLIASLIFLGTNISGGSFNPARSIPAAFLTQNPTAMRSISLYITAPILGGLLGGVLKNLFE